MHLFLFINSLLVFISFPPSFIPVNCIRSCAICFSLLVVLLLFSFIDFSPFPCPSTFYFSVSAVVNLFLTASLPFHSELLPFCPFNLSSMSLHHLSFLSPHGSHYRSFPFCSLIPHTFLYSLNSVPTFHLTLSSLKPCMTVWLR